METQKYTVNINLFREITSTKTKHSNLLVSVILLFINEHYRKTNEGKNTTKQKKTKIKNKQRKKDKASNEISCSHPPPFSL